MTRVIALEYHDVVPVGDFSSSGFSGPGADSYKLTATAFDAHLAAVAATGCRAGLTADEALPSATGGRNERRAPVLLTFDDGGRSALTAIAPRLEALGWHGHFFMTSGQIGARGFLTASDLRELHARGHVIGSHSHSHPVRMSAVGVDGLRREWAESVALLSDILGTQVRTASVPGGYFSRVVAETAADVGVQLLFTSEPTSRPTRIGSCTVLGRYTLRRDDPGSRAADLVAASHGARVRQWSIWNAKKVLKALGGESYLRARARVFGSS
ncbi:MAG: polysaccharide deacetylase family protein [Gemmatimonadaceae bacterium]